MEAISFSFKIYKMTDEIPPHGASWLSIVIVYSSCASLVNLFGIQDTQKGILLIFQCSGDRLCGQRQALVTAKDVSVILHFS